MNRQAYRALQKEQKGSAQRTKILLACAPLLLWILIIFSFSAQPYEHQDISPQLSRMFQSPFWEKLFAPVSFSYHGSLISVEMMGIGKFMEFFVRKGAHFIIYFVLSFLTARVLTGSRGMNLKKLVLILTFVTLFAASDEIHQMFTEGRSPMLEDVMVDAAGGGCGLVVYLLLKKRKKEYRIP